MNLLVPNSDIQESTSLHSSFSTLVSRSEVAGDGLSHYRGVNYQTFVYKKSENESNVGLHLIKMMQKMDQNKANCSFSAKDAVTKDGNFVQI